MPRKPTQMFLEQDSLLDPLRATLKVCLEVVPVRHLVQELVQEVGSHLEGHFQVEQGLLQQASGLLNNRVAQDLVQPLHLAVDPHLEELLHLAVHQDLETLLHLVVGPALVVLAQPLLLALLEQPRLVQFPKEGRVVVLEALLVVAVQRLEHLPNLMTHRPLVPSASHQTLEGLEEIQAVVLDQVHRSLATEAKGKIVK